MTSVSLWLLNTSSHSYQHMRAVVSLSSVVSLGARVQKHPSLRTWDTWERGKKINKNVSTVNQDASQPPNNGLPRREEGKKVKRFHPFKGEGLRWGVFKKWKSDSRGKTKTEKQWGKKRNLFFVFKVSQAAIQNLSAETFS